MMPSKKALAILAPQAFQHNSNLFFHIVRVARRTYNVPHSLLY